MLEGIEPGRSPIDLSVGEPGHPMPDLVGPILADHIGEFSKYPPIWGTPELRDAIAGWIGRRYPPLRGQIDAERQILPLCGSREGLFSAIFPALSRRSELSDPIVLIPNPYYFSYAAAAAGAKAQAVYMEARPEFGFLPDFEAIQSDLLDRTVAMYLASPSNPEGAVAGEDYLEAAIGLARAHDFVLFADECYSEIWIEAPPAGALETAYRRFGDFHNLIVFQSLSKRSNLPGLRSGFCAGDPDFIASYAALRNVACPQMPLPLQDVSAALWRDEAHVEANRQLYRAKFEAAARILGGRLGFYPPQGGFFLWLNVSQKGGGEAAAATLWKAYGVKVLPGAFLGHQYEDGTNPGKNYVRLALVGDLPTTEEALARIVEWAESE